MTKRVLYGAVIVSTSRFFIMKRDTTALRPLESAWHNHGMATVASGRCCFILAGVLYGSLSRVCCCKLAR
ncbi:MAG: hypothetical protein JRI39_11830 [Deltaproteobacteria bacterium]|nr:hypothetical protein [Deltaproteobacteria bacterium]MBW2083742.1 hypothetical protein [Deltaproteobacteria bacterium]HDM10732.1 hypothetical protein [Desulfobacteraceae bacterium]